MKTENYLVCRDCFDVLNGFLDEITPKREDEIKLSIRQEIASTKANSHFVEGGELAEEFSKQSCELCHSRLAGQRFTATMLIPNK